MPNLLHKTLVALLFGSAIFLSGCDSSKVSADVVITDSKNIASLLSDSLVITYYEDGKMGYKFSTPHMERYEFGDEPYMEFKEGIHIITFDENGNERSDLVADYAKYIESKGLWEAKGNVRGRDNEGKELYTEQLFWDENSDKIYSNVDTKVVNGDEVTLGSGFESDGQLNNVRFLNTKGRLLVDTTRQAQPTVQNQ